MLLEYCMDGIEALDHSLKALKVGYFFFLFFPFECHPENKMMLIRNWKSKVKKFYASNQRRF